jgi:CubicO group peptidase (beta-lactamase class C family)
MLRAHLSARIGPGRAWRPPVVVTVVGLAVAAGVFAPPGAGQQSPRDAAGLPWPTSGWTQATPASQKLSADALDALDRDVRAGLYGNIDAVAVVRNGRLVVDRRYPRDYGDISRGRTGPIGCGEGCADPAWMHQYNYFHPRWHPYHDGRDVHSLQSVTKSIAATVVGIALGAGGGAALERPFLEFFKDRDLSRIDPRLRRATLHDLLTMRSGIEWHEGDRPLDDTNTTVQLEKSADWIAFTLAQPMDADPGTKWTYNSGGSQLMAGIVRAATGRHIGDYAREQLFGPLGISDVHWKLTPTGHPDTEGGLYLAPLDLAKIGYLYLRGGEWDGRRVLPQGWVTRATTRHARAVAGGWDYGYQWWITARGGHDIWAGRGFGGQFLIVIPSRDIVAVTLAWNVFGGRTRNIFDPLVDALLRDAPGGPVP